jgi:hypothetical protein
MSEYALHLVLKELVCNSQQIHYFALVRGAKLLFGLGLKAGLPAAAACDLFNLIFKS